MGIRLPVSARDQLTVSNISTIALSQSKSADLSINNHKGSRLKPKPWASTSPLPSPISLTPCSTGVDRSTYYDSKKRMNASLIRARKPYLWKNFFTGIALSGIAVGICARPRLGPRRD
jgi:hypothetical protein